MKPPDFTDRAATGESAWRFGRYTVLAQPDGSPCEIGRGAMGVTYKAIDDALGRVVVLKLIQSGVAVNPESRRRFRHEARLTAQLNHPHIATVYDAGCEGEADYYVMEFIDGEDALRRLGREGPFSWQVVLSIGEQVAQALEKAWQHQKMVHRDLKPANLMLLGTAGRVPARPFVKVIDFGLARLLEPENAADALVSLAGFKGTPAYASPEQCEQIELDTRSDIYSLGITLWHLLTGKLPFRGSFNQILSGHISKPPPLQELTGVPPPLLDLLRVMLAKQREDRPDDPTLLLAAMERVRAALESSGGSGAAKWPEPGGGAAGTPPESGPGAIVGLRSGDVFAQGYRLAEELPVARGRRRFRALPLALSRAGEPVCLDGIEPQVWSDTAAAGRLDGVIDLTNRLTPQSGLWSCSAVMADAGRGLRFVERAPVAGRTLLDEIRHRARTPGREEIRRWLEPLPVVLDAMADAEFTPAALGPESLLLGEAVEAGVKLDALQPLFAAWSERFAVAAHTSVETVPPPPSGAVGAGPVPVLARLIYDLSGGSLAALDRAGYRPVAVWDEDGNQTLRRALRGEFPDCRTFWAALGGGKTGEDGGRAAAGGGAARVPSISTKPPTHELVGRDGDPAGGWENRLGMRFRVVPGTGVHFCLWPTRLGDYATFATGSDAASGQLWKQPGFLQQPDHPVVGVSFLQAQAFCRWLSGLDGYEYRLPTDAEWSVAVGLAEGDERPAGSRFPWGDGWPPPRDAGRYAVGKEPSGGTARVGSYRENAFGLYDLGGNVWEWCTDPIRPVGM